MTAERTTGYNTGLAKVAVQGFNEVLCFVSRSVVAESSVLPYLRGAVRQGNPPMRQAQKRYGQA